MSEGNSSNEGSGESIATCSIDVFDLLATSTTTGAGSIKAVSDEPEMEEDFGLDVI